MKNDVLDVLLYIFERFENDDYFIIEEAQKLADELTEVGFTEGEIGSAFDWIDALATLRENQEEHLFEQIHSDGFRVFSSQERRILGQQGLSLLVRLEQSGLIDFAARELIIDRILALKMDTVSYDQVQWIAMMVLSNLEGYEQACAWFELQADELH